MEEGPSLIRELEFGCELGFFTANQARAKGRTTVDGKQYDRYELKILKWRLELLYDRQGAAPFEVSIYEGKRPLQVLRYDSYQPGLEPDMSLFKKPDGIEIKEPEEASSGA